MPTLLIFAPCEKLIVSAEGGMISLISVMERLQANIPQEIPLVRPAAVPMRWALVSIWHRDASDEGKRYEQVFRVIGQDGRTVIHTEPTEITTTVGKPRCRIIIPMTQFPVTDGSLAFRVLYREVGQEEWTLKAEYPVEVSLSRESEAPAPSPPHI